MTTSKKRGGIEVVSGGFDGINGHWIGTICQADTPSNPPPPIEGHVPRESIKSVSGSAHIF
ncbi:MAG: hypothetical protein DYG83_11365 [Candidatus Brocadia sp. AMX2]|uniref:Uncharacterized protein n=1 Tax=Candidatus Brocadia sinica JPN1 TaxID=1197129 RepID=A0ABQ0JS65_9BACT|nr:MULTISPECIES: hypothetical protein [Brocadia]MBC6933098.1 hypothetical protein [Candidatus Brocadia sp.]MBL1168423.1 hypothetical protein [Candidatus Brocadia sp. AMX1]NOG43169.1 hypothetical protein [Planctomycetota bacterium]GIK12402.1 MAG: hypothetical protein BroJett002_11090 [Candidatus Brocadia sinica]KAA0242827.1 MAG: hypothetical protein EDM70_12665 [Candidatus Brocadia sp. AMX2]